MRPARRVAPDGSFRTEMIAVDPSAPAGAIPTDGTRQRHERAAASGSAAARPSIIDPRKGQERDPLHHRQEQRQREPARSASAQTAAGELPVAAARRSISARRLGEPFAMLHADQGGDAMAKRPRSRRSPRPRAPPLPAAAPRRRRHRAALLPGHRRLPSAELSQGRMAAFLHADRLRRAFLGRRAAREMIDDIVADIKAETGGRIDVLVVTHEHWDHVSGFVTAGEIVQGLLGRRGLDGLDREPGRSARRGSSTSSRRRPCRRCRAPDAASTPHTA